MLREVLRLTNRRARLLVGLLLAGLFCVQCTQTDAGPQSRLAAVVKGVKVGSGSAAIAAQIEQLARTDQIALLQYCLDNYQGRYRDYTCTLVKQERIRGTLSKEQWLTVKFLGTPFSVAMKWTKNAPIGDHVLYVEGKYNNQMLVKPAGLLAALVGTVMRAPDDAEARKNTLRPVNMFGFQRGMENLLDVYRQAKREGDLKEAFGEYAKVDGRDAVVLVRYLPAKHDYPAYETKVYIDLEYLVPVLIEGKDWDNQLVCSYLYKDIKFNVGLTEEDFLPQANEMQPPK